MFRLAQAITLALAVAAPSSAADLWVAAGHPGPGSSLSAGLELRHVGQHVHLNIGAGTLSKDGGGSGYRANLEALAGWSFGRWQLLGGVQVRHNAVDFRKTLVAPAVRVAAGDYQLTLAGPADAENVTGQWSATWDWYGPRWGAGLGVVGFEQAGRQQTGATATLRYRISRARR